MAVMRPPCPFKWLIYSNDSVISVFCSCSEQHIKTEAGEKNLKPINTLSITDVFFFDREISCLQALHFFFKIFCVYIVNKEGKKLKRYMQTSVLLVLDMGFNPQ